MVSSQTFKGPDNYLMAKCGCPFKTKNGIIDLLWLLTHNLVWFPFPFMDNGFSSISSHNERQLLGDTEWDEEYWVVLWGSMYSFIHSVIQWMNKCTKYFLDSRTHAFIFWMNESHNPCLQRTQGFVRAPAKEKAIKIKGVWNEPNGAQRGYRKASLGRT